MAPEPNNQHALDKLRTELSFCREELIILNRYIIELIEKNSPSVREEVLAIQHQINKRMHLGAQIDVSIAKALQQSTDPYGFQDESLHHFQQEIDAFCHAHSQLKSQFVRYLAHSKEVE